MVMEFLKKYLNPVLDCLQLRDPCAHLQFSYKDVKPGEMMEMLVYDPESGQKKVWHLLYFTEE